MHTKRFHNLRYNATGSEMVGTAHPTLVLSLCFGKGKPWKTKSLSRTVTPAQAGVHLANMDSRLRGNEVARGMTGVGENKVDCLDMQLSQEKSHRRVKDMWILSWPKSDLYLKLLVFHRGSIAIIETTKKWGFCLILRQIRRYKCDLDTFYTH